MKVNVGDLRTEKSEEAIRAAFFELVRERGFEHVTVGELCRRARVGRSTFYDHHEDKYELLSCLVGEVMARARTMMSERFATTADVAAAVGGAYAWFASERDELSCLLTIHVPEADLAAQFRELLEEGLAERVAGDEGAEGDASTVPIELLAKLYASSALTMLEWVLVHGDEDGAAATFVGEAWARLMPLLG